MKDIYDALNVELQELKDISRFRSLNCLEKRENQFLFIDGKKYLNFSSNDYLGLSNDKELYEEFFRDLKSTDFATTLNLGSSSSRLLTGHSKPYEDLENYLASVYEKEAALVFNSGYHANAGIIPALCKKGDVVFSDKLNHASLIDGMKISDADFFRYAHNDLEQLENILKKKRQSFRRAVIVVESLFSMDGDFAPLEKLIDLKKKYGCFLYVDEAHSVGCYGDKGLGYTKELNLLAEVDIFLGTFGKALGGMGAFLICKQSLKDYLINFMRPLIFSTALPPLQIAWNHFMFKKNTLMNEKREHLKSLSHFLRSKIEKLSLESRGSSHIIPIIIGDNEKTIMISKKLQNKGFWVSAIRPPTVPKGSSRLRLSLTANLKKENVESFVDNLRKLV